MQKSLPHFKFEKELWEKGYLVIGVDEVGRGALAGPVGVGAVCFKPESCSIIEKLGINDSKKLSAKQREKLQIPIKKHVLASSVTFSSVETINTIGIVKAVNQAVRKALNSIQEELQSNRPIFLLLDAFNIKNIRGIGLKNQQAIIRGDAQSISIAGASILAKVRRDLLMQNLGSKYPQYYWYKNKGYGTESHLNAIQHNGIVKEHRKLFVRNILKKPYTKA